MKKILILGFFVLLSVNLLAQNKKEIKTEAGDIIYFTEGENNGKTYYDTTKTKVKELFTFVEVSIFNPRNPSKMRKKKKKNGAYFMYFEDGKIKVQGKYKNDKKDGKWEYYDKNKKVIKKEEYSNGVLN